MYMNSFDIYVLWIEKRSAIADLSHRDDGGYSHAPETALSPVELTTRAVACAAEVADV